jgi:predicted SAM-dependent methyltransferase
MNLNLGSGQKSVKNYVCIDKSPRLLLSKLPLGKLVGRFLERNYEAPWDKQVKYMDVRKLQFRENSVSNIYSSHLLEHLYMYEAKKLLEDCFHFLMPGGVLRLALPNYHEFILQYVSDYVKDPVDAYFIFESSLLSWPLERQKTLERLLSTIFGRLHVHKWHPTPFIVKKFLEDIGFINVTDYRYHVGTIPDLIAVETRDEGTFYLEATKPINYFSGQ